MVLPLLFTIHCSLFTISCGAGDDDGHRLGDIIVGTWQRGWGEGDVIIEGDTDLEPMNFSYDKFEFRGDGSYNGMVRQGSFSAWDRFGSLIYEGAYQCDNNNMRLEYTDSEGVKRKILAQVTTFSDEAIWLRYENEDYGVTVSFVIRKAAPLSLSLLLSRLRGSLPRRSSLHGQRNTPDNLL